jgi:hypothetical protein
MKFCRFGGNTKKLEIKANSLGGRGGGPLLEGFRKKMETFDIKINENWSQSYDFELQRQRCKIYSATNSMARLNNKKYISLT